MFRRKTLADLLTQSLRRADASGDVAPNWITGVEDAVIRQDLEALLDAKDSDARLDAGVARGPGADPRTEGNGIMIAARLGLFALGLALMLSGAAFILDALS